MSSNSNSSSAAINSQCQHLTAQQSLAARDLLQVEVDIKGIVNFLKKLKINKNDTWI